MENKSLKIGVLGLGLIGGSILKALNLLGKYTLIAVSKSSFRASAEYCSVSGEDIALLKPCDLIFVCSKMSETKELLKRLEKIVSKDTIVADVCSLKDFLTDDYNFNYVPTHPMAGSELSGFENSNPYLFEGAKWITGKENLIINSLIKEMGAIPYLLNSNTHDILAAEISHLPMLLSFALFYSVDTDAKKIASSGFRDFTRYAMTNPDLAFDMLKFNRKNIMEQYEKFDIAFKKLCSLDENEFKKTVENIAQKRRDMYDINGKNIL
ncbi:MAG: prephenate dehydrogenase/arogenate dehydrogenase family protein [Candidatus Gastranaerophilales bacterium]|nr:prephenate dehydrogenase/arogenate dehydrogenase family protein [Candidatus Gastranaerophilales bacterium]